MNDTTEASRDSEFDDLVPPFDKLPKELKPGDRLGDFVLGDRIGRGGFGTVYEARQVSVGRHVAVKVLGSFGRSSTRRERFRREVAVIGRLSHPAIVPVYISGEAHDRSYYAMERIEGATLHEVLVHLSAKGRRPTTLGEVRELVNRRSGRAWTQVSDETWRLDYVTWCVRTMMELAEALQHAHDNGILHRDVKPANLMITGEGRPVLIDFGLALDESSDIPALTSGDGFLGTRGYAAPEQVSRTALDVRVDVYSLGATFYHLLGLTKPFSGADDHDLHRRIEYEQPRPLDASLPRDVRVVCERAMAKLPSRRTATAADLSADLRRLLEGQPVESRPIGVCERWWYWVVRRRVLIATAVSAFIVAGVALATARWRTANKRMLDVHAKVEALESAVGEMLAGRAATAPFDSGHGERLLYSPRYSDQLRQEQSRKAYRRARNDLMTHHREVVRTVAGVQDAWCLSAAEDCLKAAAETAGRALWVDLADVLDPESLEEVLATNPSMEGAPSELGLLSIEVHPPHSLIEIEGIGLVGSGHVVQYLAPGTYEITVSSDRLGAQMTCPVYVRADSIWDPGVVSSTHEFRAGEYRFDLEEASLCPDGYVYLPAGWTIVGDPAHWEWVDSCFIQKTEVTLGQWVDLLNTRGVDVSSAVWGGEKYCNPLFDGPGSGVLSKEGEVWRAKVEANNAYPLRGVDRMAMRDACQVMNSRATHDDYYYDLPSLLEWEKAARGPAGLTYVWEPFTSDPDAWLEVLHPNRGNGPHRVYSSLDLSPYGLYGVAASVAELTRTAAAGGRVVKGASPWQDSEPAPLRLDGRRTVGSGAEDWVGFRPVLRRIPRWLTPPPAQSGKWREEFEEPLSSTGWVVSSGISSRHPNPSNYFDQIGAKIDGGKLKLTGGRGFNSNYAAAWHGLNVVSGEFRMTLECTLKQRLGTGFKYAQIALCDNQHPTRGTRVALKWNCDGWAQLGFGEGERHAPASDEHSGLWLEKRLSIELVVSQESVVAHIATVDAPGNAVTVERNRPSESWNPRIIGLIASDNIGMSLEVDWVLVDPLGADARRSTSRPSALAERFLEQTHSAVRGLLASSTVSRSRADLMSYPSDIVVPALCSFISRDSSITKESKFARVVAYELLVHHGAAKYEKGLDQLVRGAREGHGDSSVLSACARGLAAVEAEALDVQVLIALEFLVMMSGSGVEAGLRVGMDVANDGDAKVLTSALATLIALDLDLRKARAFAERFALRQECGEQLRRVACEYALRNARDTESQVRLLSDVVGPKDAAIRLHAYTDYARATEVIPSVVAERGLELLTEVLMSQSDDLVQEGVDVVAADLIVGALIRTDDGRSTMEPRVLRALSLAHGAASDASLREQIARLVDGNRD